MLSVAIPLGIYSISAALFFPLTQSVIYFKVCIENWNAMGISSMDCANRGVSSSSQLLQTEANNIFLLASILMPTSASLAATVIGKLGDQRSRKMALAVPFVGLLVSDATLLLQVYFMETSSYWFLLSESIFGCFGGYVAIFSSSFGYTSAMAKNSGLDRSKAIARLEGSVGVGSILGFFCTYAVPKFGYFAGFAFMAALHVICLLCVVAFMQDIRPSEDVLMANETNCEGWTLMFKDERRASRIVLLTSCFRLSFFAVPGTLHILFFYLKQRFSWDMEQYSQSFFSQYYWLPSRFNLRCSCLVLRLYTCQVSMLNQRT
ncbi:Protein Y43F8A.5 [Aphelenchoides avenae]|nr:Protein Y43F8A.5 [Aphelenchus avenae]